MRKSPTTLHCAPLKLCASRAPSTVLPASERFEACKSFIEGPLELRDGEARLLQARPEPVGPSVAELQRKIDQLARTLPIQHSSSQGSR